MGREITVEQVGPEHDGLLSVIRDPELYDRIADDDSPPAEDFRAPDGLLYLLGSVDGQPASAFIADGEVIHYMVVKHYRRWARDLLNLSILESGMHRMVCEIPECFPEVINFAKHAGFLDSGYGRSIIRDETIHHRKRLIWEVQPWALLQM